jgi:3-isopropylmalate/(R)-2-methylmalate dehydratase small subunit
MQSVFTGPVYVVKDNIDTDQIIPAQYLNLVPTIKEEYEKLGSYALIAMGAANARIVVAESFARIFFRNCVATGELYPCETAERLCDVLQTGDVVTVDLDAATVKVEKTGKVYVLKPLGDVKPVVDAGGIFNFARQSGMIPKAA